MRRWVCVFVAFFIQNSFAFAGSFEDTLTQLKNEVGEPLSIGSLCEKVAQYQIEKSYPKSKYKIRNGIEYYRARESFSNSEDSEDSEVESQTTKSSLMYPLGELDLVVFDKLSHKAVLIAEVKCRHDLPSAGRKARKQRSRFQAWIHHSKDLEFQGKDSEPESVSPDQFDENIPFILISQKGGKKAGFDLTLDFTLSELVELNDRLADSIKAEWHVYWSKKKRKLNPSF